MSRVDTRHRTPRFGRLLMIAGILVPLVAAGWAEAGTRQFLVILAHSPKQFGGGLPPGGLPNPTLINEQYFDRIRPDIDSFAEYWDEISYGDVQITGKTTDWIILPWPISTPTTPAITVSLLPPPDLFTYGAGEEFKTDDVMILVDLDGNPGGGDDGPFNVGQNPPYARGGKDTVPGADTPVWMPGERFVDMDGDGRWDGLDEARNTMDFFDNATGLPLPDGRPDLRGPWVDVDGDGAPNNPANCVFFPDIDNDGSPDCCPDGPGTPGCPSLACPGLDTDCNGNLIPDPCDASCTSQACLDTGWLDQNPGKCGGSQDELPNVVVGTLCQAGPGDGIPDECQFASLDPCGADPQDPDSDDQCARSVPQCVMLPELRGQGVMRCEYDDSNGNGVMDIVEPFENFLRRWDVATARWIIMDDDYIRDNYIGDAEKVVKRGTDRTLYAPHAAPGARCKCADGNDCENITFDVEGREVTIFNACPAGVHAQFDPPDQWTELGSTKMNNPAGMLVGLRTPEPEWYRQSWIDRYGTEPPPWTTEIPNMQRFDATQRRCFRASRGGVNGDGTGWVGCSNFDSVVFFDDGALCPDSEDSVGPNFTACDARILPEELAGIGLPTTLFDGVVEHDDLPSSKYHIAGDKRLGEVTSPFNEAIWGEDRAQNNPNVPPVPDRIIEPGGPYAIQTHGNFSRDAGNVLNMEMLTWRTSPPFNNGTAWETDVVLDDRVNALLTVNHPYAGPSGSMLGFRDYNLDGMVDQGSVFFGGDHYRGGPVGGNGTDSPYPWNRRRILEDSMAVLDDVIDFDDFVDTVSLDRILCPFPGAELTATVNSALRGGGPITHHISAAGVLSGIVLLPPGSHGAGDFPISPQFFPIHNEDGLGDPDFLSQNLPPSKRSPSGAGEFRPRISWNLFVHDLVIAAGGASRFTVAGAAVGAAQTPYSAHEYLHAWERFPDLYDYDVFDNPQAENCPVGFWDIMANGGLVHPAPILKEKPCTEWTKPVDLASLLTPGVDTVLTLPPAEFVRDNSYFFLENDKRLGERYYFWSAGLGFDRRMPGDGLLVMHTDVGSNTEALPQGQRSADRPKFLIVQSDGRADLQTCSAGGNRGDGGDAWPGVTNTTRFNFDTVPSATWFSQNSWTGIDVLDVEPDGTGAVRLTINWVPTSIPSLRFVQPAGGASVGSTFQVRFQSTDVFGGTNVRLFFIPDSQTCNGNGASCEKTADCPAGQFCRHDTSLSIGTNATLINQVRKTTPGTSVLSADWDISDVPDGRYVLFAKLQPGPGADGTEDKLTSPRAGRNNVGDGSLTVTSVAIDNDSQDADDTARLETWTVTAISAATDTAGAKWRVNGTLTQPVINEIDPNQDPWPKAETGVSYSSVTGNISFAITAGPVPFSVGDTFIFSTTGITAPSKAVTVIDGRISEDPVARIVAAPLSGEPPLKVDFDARSSVDPNGDPLTFRWDFGDGTSTASGPIISHTFSTFGTFTVVLRATNARNQRIGLATVDIQVTNNSPNAAFTARPTSGQGPLEVAFDAAQSSDRETSEAQLIYKWDFGDGTGANDLGLPGLQIATTHTYRSRVDGTPCTPSDICAFNVTLTVTDEGGKQDTATTTIVVGNSNPVVSVTVSPLRGSNPLEVRFNASGSTDADGDDLTVVWHWDDGTPDLTLPLSGQDGEGNVTHTYTAEGSYTPTATVTDSSGGTAAWPGVEITVTAPVAGSSDPRAIFHICAQAPCNVTDPALPLLAELFAVDGAQSVDRPAGGSITAYSWNWGDGSTLDSGVTATHTYTTAGTFTITLTVTDAETPPNIASFSRIATVAEDGGGAGTGNEAPVPFFVVDPPSGVASETEFRFDASGSNDPDGDNAKLTYSWSFGDDVLGSGRVVRHVYAAPNQNGFVVRLTVRDEKNASRSLTDVVVVTDTSGNRRPVAVIGTGPRAGSAPFTLALDAGNSFDPDGDSLEYRWEFRAAGEVIDVLAGAAVSRVFADSGTFEVELRVSDGRGGVSFAGPQPIRVTPRVAPPVDAEPGQGVPIDNSPANIPDSANQRSPFVCGLGMLMAMIGSLVGLTLMAASRRRRR